MEQFWLFVTKNVEWIFSGIGVSVILSGIGLFIRKKNGMKINQKVIGSNFTADKMKVYNTSGLSVLDVKELIKSAFIENMPRFQEIAKLEAETNRDYFIAELDKRIKERLSVEEINKFNKPGIQFALINAIIAASCSNNQENREILSNLIINRIKFDGSDFESILYNEAIKNISRLTRNQIGLLTFIEAYTTLFTSILMSDSNIKINLLCNYLKSASPIYIGDIDHCKSYGLINSLFPYEWDIDFLRTMEPIPPDLQSFFVVIFEIYDKLESYGLKSLSLSPVGRVIAKENIFNLIGEPKLNNIDITQKLSDFKANNISAMGEVTAFAILKKKL